MERIKEPHEVKLAITWEYDDLLIDYILDHFTTHKTLSHYRFDKFVSKIDSTTPQLAIKPNNHEGG